MAKKDDRPKFNKNDVAYMLGVDVRMVTNYQNQADDPLPIMTKGRRGEANEYDPQEVMRWRLRMHLKEMSVVTSRDGLRLNERAERARLFMEQADAVALRNAQARKELAPISLISEVLNNVAMQVIAILETIPGMMKKRLPFLKAAEIELIKREISKAEKVMAAINEQLDDYEPPAES